MKTLYNILAVLAITHLLVLGGLVGTMAGAGKLTAEKVQKIASVLRGDDPNAARVLPPASQPTVQAVLARASAEAIEQGAVSEELLRLNVDRRQRDLSDRKALIDAAMLKFTREREVMAKQIADMEHAQKLASQTGQQVGAEREVSIISGLSAKNARDLLMKKPMPDAVRMMIAMKPRTATDIIESCKMPEEKAWASQVLAEITNEDKGRAQQMAKAMR